MIKLKKIDYEAIIKQDDIPQDIEKKLYFKMFYKNIIYLIILWIILIISLVLYQRLLLFSTILSGGKYFVVVLYYLTMVLDISLLTTLCSYTFYQKRKGNQLWYRSSYTLLKKLDLPTFFCHCLCGLFFIIAYIITPCNVSGDSMNNTFMDKDKLVCSNLFYTPKKNDVIVFDSSRYTEEKNLYIKRVVAVEEDEVSYDSKSLELFVDGVVIAEGVSIGQYGAMLESIGITEYQSKFTVPANKLIVLGDNRRVSYDSRYFGLIDEKDIYGKVLFRIYPMKKIRIEILE